MNSVYFPKAVALPTLNDIDLSNILDELTEQPNDYNLFGDTYTIYDPQNLDENSYQFLIKFRKFKRDYIDSVYTLSQYVFWEKFRTGTFDYFEKKELITVGTIYTLYMEGIYNVGLRRTIGQYSDDYKMWIWQNRDLLLYYSNIELLMFSPFNENDIINHEEREQFMQLKNQLLFTRSSIILWNQRCDFLSFLHECIYHDERNVARVLNDPFFKREICQWL